MTINPDGRRQGLGALSGSREPDPSCTGSGPSGFDPERYRELAECCEETTGPDREIDARIWCLLNGHRFIKIASDDDTWGDIEGSSRKNTLMRGWLVFERLTYTGTAADIQKHGGRFQQYSCRHGHEFTASVDAAMTLVPEGHVMAVTNCGTDSPRGPDWTKASAVVGREEDSATEPVTAATPALALCAAALKARAAIRIEAGTGGTVKLGPTRSARAGAEGIARHD